MRLKLVEAWRRIRSSFWFLPSLMVGGAITLAFVNLFIDHAVTATQTEPPPWLAVAGAESARSLLSTIAGSMITVAGVTFSIVIVALTLASSQYGPRLVAGFMQDTGNQVVLGTFVSVFTYCLVVLLHLPGEAGSRLLPQVSVLTGVALAIVALGVLIYFFHHISTAIQAGGIVREAGLALESAIRFGLPEQPAADVGAWPPEGFSEANARLRAPRAGYLSAVDVDRLTAIGADRGLRIMIRPRAGDFVLAGRSLAWITPADALRDDVEASIIEALALVERREDANDLPMAVQRLTEIAVRGLSPGINDPYTAVAAVDRLTVGLDRLLDRLPSENESRDPAGRPRVYFRPPDGEDLLELAYGPVRTYGRRDVRILEALVDGLARLAEGRRRRWNAALRAQVGQVLETARSSLELAADRKRVEARYERARALLRQQETSS